MGYLSTPRPKVSANDFRQGTPDPSQVFLLNPHNQKFLEGKVRWLGGKSFGGDVGCLLIFMLPFLAVGIFFVGGLIHDWQKFTALSDYGVSATGEVTEKRVSSDDEGDRYYLSFSYLHDDKRYEMKQNVDQNTYDRSDIGSAIAIEYVPAQPHTAVLAGWNVFPYLPFIFSICWNLFIWPIFIAIVMQMRRNWLLVREGQLIRGQVMSSTTSIEGEDKNFYLAVKYGFTPPYTGKKLIGTTKVQRDDLREKPLPGHGAPLAVLYRNEQHHMAL